MGSDATARLHFSFSLFDPHAFAQPIGKDGSSECQRPVENWANRPQQISIVSLHGRELLAAAHIVLPKPEFLPSTICFCNAFILEMMRQMSLTWSRRRKIVVINKRCEVTGLREILLQRVQICIMQRRPLMTGGGSQLLFVCGVVILQVELGLFWGLCILKYRRRWQW